MRIISLILLCSCIFWGCQEDVVPVKGSVDEDYSFLLGGENSVADFSENAFSFQSPGLYGIEELQFYVGNSFFKQDWVTSPSSTTARDGLGPLFNTTSCSGCHFKDGRGRPPEYSGELGTGLLLRFSIGQDNNGAPIPHPQYGSQLQDVAINGVAREGSVVVNYTEIQGTFQDGEPYSLRRPTYSVEGLNYGSLEGVMMSPRISRQMIGLGLIEAISDVSILALADPNDSNQDGVSGVPNYVLNEENGFMEIGRFGWKGDQPTIKQQVAKAFLRDLGITSPYYPIENCTDAQNACENMENGGTPEIEEDDFNKVLLYVTNLAVPIQRDYDRNEVQRGRELFESIGCVSCHNPSITTGTSSTFSHLNKQEIHPYTDLLLHDMGEGLADDMPMFDASGSEWQTPPLWGIGLFESVNHHTYYLHDGRARSLTEAILWHGGEAEGRRNAFLYLNKSDREALLSFLNSL